MPTQMKIDFVSDVSCPWCIIGLRALEQAIARIPELEVEFEFQPFELNPDMVPEGENTAEHVMKKYGSNPERSAASRKAIKDSDLVIAIGARLGEMTTSAYTLLEAPRLSLAFAGLDTCATVLLNGVQILQCDNMFLPQEVDLSPHKGGLLRVEDQLAIWFPTAKFLLV